MSGSNSECGNTDYGSIMVTKLEDKSVAALLSDSKALYLYLYLALFIDYKFVVLLGQHNPSTPHSHPFSSDSQALYLYLYL